MGKLVGNKGGVAQSFMLLNRPFNFIAVHLKHGQDNADKRNQMASDLIREMKLWQFQQSIGGLESDQLAEFSFFMGDLNYRLKTTFNELNNTNVKEKALELVKKDQFFDAQKLGHYPNYIEPNIDFLPSYKMSSDSALYIDKKQQPPSYCDRVLYKNNSSLEVEEDFYTCLHDVFGSDHRPV